MSENNSQFKTMQKDVCRKDPLTPIEKDKICPVCIPNPNALEPTWWDTAEPYLNEKTCEYTVSVAVNDFGEAFTTQNLPNSDYYNSSLSDPLTYLRKTYL